MAPSSRRLAVVARHLMLIKSAPADEETAPAADVETAPELVLGGPDGIQSMPAAADVETAPELVLGAELPDRPPVVEMDPNLSVKAGHSEETLTELRMAALEEHGFVSAISS